MAIDDPYAKVAQAQHMTEAGRAAQAQRLLNEAMGAFEEKGDNLGLAEAHRQFGFLARTGGGREGVLFVRDPETTVLTRADWDLSEQHFNKAAELFQLENRPDMVANILLNLGIGRVLQTDTKSACAYFDQSLDAYHQAEAVRPGSKVALSRNVGSFAELIAKTKAQAGCGT